MSIRDEIATLAQRPDPLTLRTLTNWYKELVRDDLSAEERLHADKAWAVYVEELAEKEQLPGGFVGYMISELAKSELTMLAVAEAEASA